MSALLWFLIALDLALFVAALWMLDRAADRAERRTQRTPSRAVVIGYAPTNPGHPHPLREPTVWVDAADDAEAWAILTGRAA